MPVTVARGARSDTGPARLTGFAIAIVPEPRAAPLPEHHRDRVAIRSCSVDLEASFRENAGTNPARVGLDADEAVLLETLVRSVAHDEGGCRSKRAGIARGGARVVKSIPSAIAVGEANVFGG